MSIVSRRGYPVNVVLHTRYTYTDTRMENINTRRVRFVSIEEEKKKILDCHFKRRIKCPCVRFLLSLGLQWIDIDRVVPKGLIFFLLHLL